MAKIQYTNDTNLAEQMVQGSDGRLNVSARSDNRAYYNSRDQQQTFSLTWTDASTAAGDTILYWKNTDTTGKHLVIEAIEINSELYSTFCLYEVTGTAAGGTATLPTCLNRASPRVAQATARTADTSAVTGLSNGVLIDLVSVGAASTEEMNLHDQLRIGQDGAIALVATTVASGPGITSGTLFGFYE